MNPMYPLFYTLKPAIPRSLQLYLRRWLVRRQRRRSAHIWPIDPSAGNPPPGWKGWPEEKTFALVLMHDVDTQAGHDKCRQLMDLEESLGFRSVFNVVPERYRVSRSLIDEIKARGFGLGVHGLKHDGKLFSSREHFERSASRINRYLADWGTRGFSSPSMHRNLEWMHLLDIDVATCTFDTDPFEPQPDGVGTIFPFVVNSGPANRSYVELPYTLPQDFTLFILMGEKTNAIWKKKLDWIASRGGMALFNSHPDYMNFGSGKNGPEEYSARLYADFLAWIKERYGGRYWPALAEEIGDRRWAIGDGPEAMGDRRGARGRSGFHTRHFR